MIHDLRSSLRPAVTLLLFFTLLLGVAYPLAITGVAQLAMPWRANGSLIVDDGRIRGSELIGQGFAAPGYFHSRLSAAGDGWDASASAASNLAPGSKDLADRIAGSIQQYRAEGLTGAVPADLVTASGSGLDPHISPAAARAQIGRVAQARGIAASELAGLVRQQIEQPMLGFLGEPRVNVLLLNRQLDRLAGSKAR